MQVVRCGWAAGAVQEIRPLSGRLAPLKGKMKCVVSHGDTEARRHGGAPAPPVRGPYARSHGSLDSYAPSP